MALWRDLDDIDRFFGPDGNYDDDLTDDLVDVCLPRRSDELEHAPSNVYLTEKAREALHPCPIRAHERQQSLVAAGDLHALAIAEACRRWLAAQAETTEAAS